MPHLKLSPASMFSIISISQFILSLSQRLYAGQEVDIWSCGVILYALLTGTVRDEHFTFFFFLFIVVEFSCHLMMIMFKCYSKKFDVSER